MVKFEKVIENARESARQILRQSKTSMLITAVSRPATLSSALLAMLSPLPEAHRARETEWLAMAILEEIDRRIPIPSVDN